MKDICKEFLAKYNIIGNMEAIALLDKIKELNIGYFDMFNFVNVYYKTLTNNKNHLQEHIEGLKSMIYAFYKNRSSYEQYEIYKLFCELVMLINFRNRNNSISG